MEKMNEEIVNVQNVPTKILTWGLKLNEPFNDKKELVLLITGNPGLSGFYTFFLATIYKFLSGNVSVWVIGHAGHDEPKINPTNVPRLKTNESLYSLDAQIQHKVDFIRRYVPADVKIHLIGHSIGAYISLQLLKIDDISKRIHYCYLLFPTFEYMAESPNGKLYIKIIQRFFKLIHYVAKLLQFLPEIFLVIAIRIIFWVRSIRYDYVETALIMIRPSVLSQIVYMSDCEMKDVLQADYETIEQNKDRLFFMYSLTDGWTPLAYYERLRLQVPDVKAQITNKFEHTFTMKTSHDMGVLVSEWIQENKVPIDSSAHIAV